MKSQARDIGIDALIMKKQDQLFVAPCCQALYMHSFFAKTVETKGAELNVAMTDNTKS